MTVNITYCHILYIHDIIARTCLYIRSVIMNVSCNNLQGLCILHSISSSGSWVGGLYSATLLRCHPKQPQSDTDLQCMMNT